MMRECLEDGSIKISNKKSDRYVLVKPAMLHYRKYKIFKETHKGDLEIDFERQTIKKPFVIPFVNDAKRSHSEGTFNCISQQNIQEVSQESFQELPQETFQDQRQEQSQETFQESYQNDFNDDFQQDFQNDFQDTFLQPLQTSFGDSFNDESW